MTTPRMLVLDLDGTTVTRRGELAEVDRRAVAALRREGVHVTIATGRLYSGTSLLARQLEVAGLVACMNGSELRDAASGSVEHGAYLCGPTRDATQRAMRANGLAPVLFESERIAHCDRSEQYLPFLRSWSRATRHYDDIHAAPAWREAHPLLAIAGVGRRSAVLGAAEALREQVPAHVEVITFPSFRDGSWYLKVRDARDDKGTALERMAAVLGMLPEHTVAVGDWLNDLPMLRRAGRSFAMGQAHETVKAAATDVCEATHETGGAVAEVARRVWGVRA